MDDDPHGLEVDGPLRAALAPPPEIVARVAFRALSRASKVQRGPRARWGVAVAALLVLVATAVWRELASRSLTRPTSLTIVGGESMLVVERSDGRRWFIGPAAERRSDGHYVIVVSD